jgi:uncharacterized phiE125 gp8 family phage protein
MVHLTTLVPPAQEPVRLSEALEHLRIDHGYDDAMVARHITAARTHIENRLSRTLISREYELRIDRWPRDGAIGLPRPPALEVLEVSYLDDNNQAVALFAEEYELYADPLSPMVAVETPQPDPAVTSLGIGVRYRAGEGPTPENVPEPLRQAVLLLTAHFYERREPLEGEGLALPYGIEALMAPYRRVRL